MTQRNVFSRTAAFMLTAALLLILLPVNALAAMTRDQSVAWAQSQIGKSIDRDGAWGPQCVDLIMAYYEDVFGTPRVGANGGDYATVSIPGSWSRIQDYIGFIPEPGDIAIWRSTPSAPQYGHVGIVESANGSTLTTIEQVNWGDGQASHVGRLTHKYANDPYTGTFWGVIRPSYGSAATPEVPAAVQVTKIEIKSNPTKTTYTQDDTLDTSGMELLVYQSNNTNRLITSGFAVSPTKLNIAGTQTITVTYQGKTTTFTVKVNSSANTDESAYDSSGGTSYSAQDDDTYDSSSETGTIPEPISQTPTSGDIALSVDMTAVGVKLNWSPSDSKPGYRIYRGSSTTGKSTSLTEAPIVGSEYIDVNVRSNTQYYYYMREVLSAPDGGAETLGDPSTGLIVTTGFFSSEATQKNRHFILMQIDNPRMSVDEESLEIDPGRGIAPIVKNGRTLVPMRAIVEAMGGTVSWDDDAQRIKISYGGHTITMTLGSRTMVVDGTASEMDIAAQTINDRTVLPVRFVSEALGCDIEWLPSTNQVVLVYEK